MDLIIQLRPHIIFNIIDKGPFNIPIKYVNFENDAVLLFDDEYIQTQQRRFMKKTTIDLRV